MKKFTVQKAYLVVMVVLSFLMSSLPGFASAASPVDLGAAAPFGGFGGSAGVTNQGIFTVVNGDIGTTAISTAVTGFHDRGGNVYTETTLNIGAVNGTVFTATAPPGSVPGVVAAAAALAAQTAFNNLSPAALPGGIDVSTLGGAAGQLGGRTLLPGVYRSVPGSYLIQGGDLTLDGGGDPNAVFVFQMASTLTVGGPGAAFPQSVFLVNGAQAKNVFWQVGSAATINAAGGGTMVGTIIASSGISFSTAGNVTVVTLNGRALVLNASLTMVNTNINVPSLAPTKIGVLRGNNWFLDMNGNGIWDAGDVVYRFGVPGDIPITGDWTGSGTTKIGVVRGNNWFLDMNGNGIWDAGDVVYRFGVPGDIPITGDWTGSGTTKIGVVRGNVWFLDMNGNGIWDAGDVVYTFGVPGDIPITGDWTGSRTTKIGVQRGNVWFLDMNGNGIWDAGDVVYTFGVPGDIPITGDWTGSGTTKIGVQRGNMWFLDVNGNGIWNAGDVVYTFGVPGDIPITGKW